MTKQDKIIEQFNRIIEQEEDSTVKELLKMTLISYLAEASTKNE